MSIFFLLKATFVFNFDFRHKSDTLGRIYDSVFYVYVVLRHNKKFEKLPKLKIWEWSVLGVRIENSGPLELARTSERPILGETVP